MLSEHRKKQQHRRVKTKVIKPEMVVCCWGRGGGKNSSRFSRARKVFLLENEGMKGGKGEDGVVISLYLFS